MLKGHWAAKVMTSLVGIVCAGCPRLACLDDNDCFSEQSPRCNPRGVCVECFDDFHCLDPVGVCVDQVCVECRRDSDCEPAGGSCIDNVCQ